MIAASALATAALAAADLAAADLAAAAFAAAAFAAHALALALADMLVAFFGGADRHLALADMCGKEADEPCNVRGSQIS